MLKAAEKKEKVLTCGPVVFVGYEVEKIDLADKLCCQLMSHLTFVKIYKSTKSVFSISSSEKKLKTTLQHFGFCKCMEVQLAIGNFGGPKVKFVDVQNDESLLPKLTLFQVGYLPIGSMYGIHISLLIFQKKIKHS